jgi:small subunit ribosomal protein S4
MGIRIKSKYKIAKRLGPIFEKTQTQKFASRVGLASRGSFGLKTEFGRALLEKQKARFTYGVNERQFKKYILESLSQKKVKPEEAMYIFLETRLDNVVYRMGLAPTRLAARQMVSHGHISVNNKRLNIPSAQVVLNDKISIMPSSRKLKLFENITEKLSERQVPSWIKFDVKKIEGVVSGLPKYNTQEAGFDMLTILDFYRR